MGTSRHSFQPLDFALSSPNVTGPETLPSRLGLLSRAVTDNLPIGRHGCERTSSFVGYGSLERFNAGFSLVYRMTQPHDELRRVVESVDPWGGPDWRRLGWHTGNAARQPGENTI